MFILWTSSLCYQSNFKIGTVSRVEAPATEQPNELFQSFQSVNMRRSSIQMDIEENAICSKPQVNNICGVGIGLL
jgi:hypothetical protein